MLTIDPRARFRSWSVKGYVYGYPKCCIVEFIDRGRLGKAPPDGPWAGSGFIPCKAHRKEAAADFRAFVDANIVPYRVYHKPFPIDEAGDPGYKWPKAKKRIKNGKPKSR